LNELGIINRLETKGEVPLLLTKIGKPVFSTNLDHWIKYFAGFT